MPTPDFLILGDSHANAIVEAAFREKVSVEGGMVTIGRNLNRDFFTCSDSDVTFVDAAAQHRYRQFLQRAGAARSADIPCPVICTFGSNLHLLARSDKWGQGFVSDAALKTTLAHQNEGAMAFVGALGAFGLSVLYPLPPRRYPRGTVASIFVRMEEALAGLMRDAGAKVIDPRPQTLLDGVLRPEFFRANDPIHGSANYGALILAAA